MYHVVPRNQARIRFVGKCLYPRRPLAYPKVCIILFDSPHSSLGKVLNGWSSREAAMKVKMLKMLYVAGDLNPPPTHKTLSVQIWIYKEPRNKALEMGHRSKNGMQLAFGVVSNRIQ